MFFQQMAQYMPPKLQRYSRRKAALPLFLHTNEQTTPPTGNNEGNDRGIAAVIRHEPVWNNFDFVIGQFYSTIRCDHRAGWGKFTAAAT